MSASAHIRKIHQMFKGLDEIADKFDRLDAMENTEREHNTRLAAIAAEVNAAADDKAKAHAEAAMLRSESKAASDKVHAEVAKVIAEVKADAAAQMAKAKDDAKALLEVARGKVADQEVKAAALEKRVSDLNSAAADAEARLVKAKEAVAKLLG